MFRPAKCGALQNLNYQGLSYYTSNMTTNRDLCNKCRHNSNDNIKELRAKSENSYGSFYRDGISNFHSWLSALHLLRFFSV